MSDYHSTDEIDPSTLKVAKLRGVLFDSGIEYPSNAKKSELVALYRKHSSNFSTDPVVIDDPISGNEIGEISSEEAAKKETKVFDENNVSIGAEKSDIQGESDDRKTSKNSEKRKKKKRSRQPSKQSENVEKIDEIVKGERKPDFDQNNQKFALNPLDVSFEKDTKVDTKSKLESQPNSPVGGKKGDTSSNFEGDVQVTPKKRRSKKRKSMLDDVDLQVSATPSKGNIFEVESDSELELLSARKKKTKHEPSSPRTPLQKVQSPKLTLTKKEERSETVTTPVPVSAPVSDPASDPVESKVAAKSPVAAIPQILKPSKRRVSKKQREANLRPKIDAPILREVSQDSLSAETSAVLSDSTEEPSIWFKTQQSFDNSQGIPDKNASVSSSFDSALSKLKKETRSEDLLTSLDQNTELTKLLNMDLSSVKPKKKGTRNITPKRPIVISQRVLSSSKRNSVVRKKETFSDDDEDDTTNTLDLTRANTDKEATFEKRAKSQTRTPHHSQKPSLFRAFSYLFVWLVLVGSLLFGYWYREQTFLVGYCGSQIDRKTVPNIPEISRILVNLGEYLDNNFKPECVECPAHARCFPRLELACYDDFVVSAPWYYSYLPNINVKAQRCVPDTKKAEKIEIMIDVALDLLRARNANENCGRADAEDPNAGLEISELHDLLLALKAPYITEEEFEELWERSVVELEKEPEIIVRHTSHFVAPAVDANDPVAETYYEGKVLRSTSLSHLSFSCMISNTVFSMVLKFKRALVIFTAVCAFVGACYWKYQQHRLHAHKVDTIYNEVLGKLRKQAKLGKSSRELPGFIGSVQLRDLILSNERNLAYKMRLWQAVSSKVDRNTNVKHELLEVHGEVMKVWQWISVIE